jgi:CelD/BcsL family acetyltransferase involved in cellulose biosynthesis
VTSEIKTVTLEGFDDPRLQASAWNLLVEQGPSPVVFLAWHWQRSWWEAFGRGKLLLVAAQRAGRLIALAPLFLDGRMIFFVGSGGSDYLDFLGDIKDVEVLASLLDSARAQAPEFLGFRFYHVLDESPTGRQLRAVASRLNLLCDEEGELPAPVLDLRSRSEAAGEAMSKKSLLRHEKFFQREGGLAVRHFRSPREILPELDRFFDQHIRRWDATPHPSLFKDETQRRFYERLAHRADEAGWLRFTRIDWNGRPIAFHFGMCYHGRYLWYKPSFEIELARRSPGEVLLRQLLLAAVEEGAHTFDFGLGDEAFKRRFASRVPLVRTWGLYPPDPRGAAPKPAATPHASRFTQPQP